MSWPRSLVPKKWPSPGGASGRPVERCGSWGASSGARAAIATKPTSTITPAQKGSDRLLMRDAAPRRQPRLDDLDRQVGREHAESGEQEERLQDRVITRPDRLETE